MSKNVRAHTHILVRKIARKVRISPAELTRLIEGAAYLLETGEVPPRPRRRYIPLRRRRTSNILREAMRY